MGFLRRFIQIFTSPGQVFDDVRDGLVPWWQPWILQSILYVIAGAISMPIQRAVIGLNTQGMTAEQLDQQLRMMDKFGWVQIVGTPPMLLLVGLALAGVTYVLVTILSSKANYRQYFVITLFASIVGGVSLLVSNLAVRMRGVDAIRVHEDAQMTLGLGFLAPEGNSVLYALFSSIEVFAVWSLVLIGMGLMRVFDMTQRQAIMCVIPWWLIYLLFAIAGQAFNGMG